jgi:hypothetical protein
MQGKARLRAAMVANGSTEGASPLCCSFWESRLGAADFGWAWCGEVRPGSTMRGYSCKRQHGGRKPSLLLSSGKWSWHGAARHGQVWPGEAIVADGSTGAFGLFCCSLWRVVLARCVLARTDWVGPGSASFGKAIVADGSTEDFGPLCCSLWRVDEARLRSARQGAARLGMVG